MLCQSVIFNKKKVGKEKNILAAAPRKKCAFPFNFWVEIKNKESSAYYSFEPTLMRLFDAFITSAVKEIRSLACDKSILLESRKLEKLQIKKLYDEMNTFISDERDRLGRKMTSQLIRKFEGIKYFWIHRSTNLRTAKSTKYGSLHSFERKRSHRTRTWSSQRSHNDAKRSTWWVLRNAWKINHQRRRTTPEK